MLVKQLIHSLLFLLLLLGFPGLPYLVPHCVLLSLDPELSLDFVILLRIDFLKSLISLNLFLFQVLEPELFAPKPCLRHVLLREPFLDSFNVCFVLVDGLYHVLLRS